MQQFLKMVDHIRDVGLLEISKDNPNASTNAPAPPWIYNLLEQAEIFVFRHASYTPGLPDLTAASKFESQNPQHHMHSKSDRILMDSGRDLGIGGTELDHYKVAIEHARSRLTLPFKVTAIEVADSILGVTDYSIGEDTSGNRFTVAVEALVIVEKAPGQLTYLSLEGTVAQLERRSWHRVRWSSFPILSLQYLERLNNEQTGIEQVRQKVRLGVGKNKRVHRINRVIHVAPKKDAGYSSLTREIDWSHRFAVRGHWRKLDGVGKDRAGDYCVSGFTWVSEHIRGPEHLPFIKKTRIVESDAP